MTTPPPATPTIASEINAATRSLHTELNRLITDRLPLALPPHASDPSLYLLGLASFANVYYTFERSWNEILAQRHLSNHTPTSDIQRDPSSFESHKDAIHDFLTTLLPPSLQRTTRLQNDLRSRFKIPRPQHRERQYMRHIAQAVHARPHVLVAYAWVMYMAIFSGGRYIRLELAATGEEFWMRGRKEEAKCMDTDVEQEKVEMTATTTTTPPVYPGFTFLHFDKGTNDGEDVKNEFKRRLAAAETLLTPSERAEVVAESRRIFESTIDLVRELDETVGKMLNAPEVNGLRGEEQKTYYNEKSSLLRPPTSVAAVRLRFAERRDAARKLAVFLCAVLVLYVLMVCFAT